MSREERIAQIIDEILQDTVPGYTIDQLSDEQKKYIYKLAAERYQMEAANDALKAVSDMLHEITRPFMERVLDCIGRFLANRTERFK